MTGTFGQPTWKGTFNSVSNAVTSTGGRSVDLHVAATLVSRKVRGDGWQDAATAIVLEDARFEYDGEEVSRPEVYFFDLSRRSDYERLLAKARESGSSNARF